MTSPAPSKWLSSFKTLPTGEVVKIRPIRSDEIGGLKAFLNRLPNWERERLNWQLVSTDLSGLPSSSISDCITYRAAAIRDQIIGLGILNYARAGPCRIVGEVNIAVDLKYRNLSVGNHLMEELLQVARYACLSKLVVKMMADKGPETMRASERWSRVRVSILRGFYHLATGRSEDLILIEMPLGLLERKREEFL